MEEVISGAIVRRYFEKLQANLAIDVAIVGARTTVVNTKRLYPGLYASGMAANNVQGGFRMGPIFGGMLKSGRKIAEIVANDLGRQG